MHAFSPARLSASLAKALRPRRAKRRGKGSVGVDGDEAREAEPSHVRELAPLFAFLSHCDRCLESGQCVTVDVLMEFDGGAGSSAAQHGDRASRDGGGGAKRVQSAGGDLRRGGARLMGRWARAGRS